MRPGGGQLSVNGRVLLSLFAELAMKKSNVTVYLEVFNEEQRIESCLRSFAWADEIIVFDKHSSDRTVEIAEKYATRVVLVPQVSASENFVNNIAQNPASSDWCFFPTASSLIHPRLVDEIIKLTTDEAFDYDVIGMPYGMYSFGIRSPHSPFFAERKFTLIRKSALKITTTLHSEISYDSRKLFAMPLMGHDEVLYHCTHKDADSFLTQTMRYTKYEAEYYQAQNQPVTLRKALSDINQAIKLVTLKRKFYKLGWDGFAISLVYVSYFITRFIYIWDSQRDSGSVVYPALREKMDRLWLAELGGELAATQQLAGQGGPGSDQGRDQG